MIEILSGKFKAFSFFLYHFLKNDKLFKYIKEIENFRKLSLQEMQVIQRNKLRNILLYSYKYVPYYKKVFNKLKINIEDINTDPVNVLKRLPPLEKKDIRENFEDLCSVKYRKSDLILDSTSGSTGESLFFAYCKKSKAYRQAIKFVDLRYLGYKSFYKKVLLWGIHPGDQKGLKKVIWNWFNNVIIFPVHYMSDEDLFKYYQIMKQKKAIVLTGYPSALTKLCEFLENNHFELSNIKAIITSAETLYPVQRELIERVLRAPVCNRYGSREFGDIAHQYIKCTGLHVHLNRVYLEILDEDLNPLPPHQTGEIYLTDLDNKGMPFLRYRIGDLASWSNKKCSCGFEEPLLEKIEGRIFDLVKTPNGNRIGGTFWTILFRERAGISQFQVYQPTVDTLIIRYVLDKKYSVLPKDSIKYWIEKIRNVCGDEMQIIFERVNEIPQTKTGKVRIVVSEV